MMDWLIMQSWSCIKSLLVIHTSNLSAIYTEWQTEQILWTECLSDCTLLFAHKNKQHNFYTVALQDIFVLVKINLLSVTWLSVTAGLAWIVQYSFPRRHWLTPRTAISLACFVHIYQHLNKLCLNTEGYKHDCQDKLLLSEYYCNQFQTYMHGSCALLCMQVMWTMWFGWSSLLSGTSQPQPHQRRLLRSFLLGSWSPPERHRPRVMTSSACVPKLLSWLKPDLPNASVPHPRTGVGGSVSSTEFSPFPFACICQKSKMFL